MDFLCFQAFKRQTVQEMTVFLCPELTLFLLFVYEMAVLADWLVVARQITDLNTGINTQAC